MFALLWLHLLLTKPIPFKRLLFISEASTTQTIVFNTQTELVGPQFNLQDCVESDSSRPAR